MVNNFYQLLEVDSSASQEAIVASYKRLHAKLSDQLCDGDEDATNQLIALREAYGTLWDTQRRQRYDEKLAARQSRISDPETHTTSFFKFLIMLGLVSIFGVGYMKYQSDLEQARLERERVIAKVKQAEQEAQKQREEKLAADEAEQRRRREESHERFLRERDQAYGNMISRNVEYAETQARLNKQRDEQQLQREEQRRVNEANQQLAREKAYLRQLEAANARYGR